MPFDRKLRITEQSELRCPHCGGDFLHHGAVERFDRGEDAVSVKRVVADEGRASIDVAANTDTLNPSGRRHALVIHFSCEHCAGVPGFYLAIAQHKGHTIAEWRELPRSG